MRRIHWGRNLREMDSLCDFSKVDADPSSLLAAASPAMFSMTVHAPQQYSLHGALRICEAFANSISAPTALVCRKVLDATAMTRGDRILCCNSVL
jgi:hypothetical protein